jgi:hypothetical protein
MTRKTIPMSVGESRIQQIVSLHMKEYQKKNTDNANVQSHRIEFEHEVRQDYSRIPFEAFQKKYSHQL